MKKVLLPLFLALILTACDSSSSDDATGEVTVADFVGTWKASSLTFASTTTSQAADLVALGGETRFTVLASGGVRTWVVLGDFSDEWDSTFSINGNQVTATPVESSRPTTVWTFQLNGSVLTMSRNNSEFDFTLSGQAPTAATETIVLQRQ